MNYISTGLPRSRKSHGISGILTFSGISGKVMEFRLKLMMVMEKSWNLKSEYCMFINRRRYAAKNPTNRFCADSVRSWNFVKWSWKSHGILSWEFRGNPVPTKHETK